MPAEVSRARGRPALTARLPMSPAQKQMAELCPDSIRSDTSRHEITAAPEGEPGTERCSTEADQRNACDLASQAFACAQTQGRLGGLRTVCFRETGSPGRATPAAYAAHASLYEPARWTALTAQRDRGPRAASPEPPRRSPRSAAPEVPSIGELPFWQSDFRPNQPSGVGRSPQAVANLWRMLGVAFKLLRTPTALTDCERRSLRLRPPCIESRPNTQ